MGSDSLNLMMASLSFLDIVYEMLLRVWSFWWANLVIERKRKQDCKMKFYNGLFFVNLITESLFYVSVCICLWAFVVLYIRRWWQRLWSPGFFIDLGKIRPHKWVRPVIVKIRTAYGTFRFCSRWLNGWRSCVGRSWSCRKSDSKSGWNQYEFIGFPDMTKSRLKIGFLHLVESRWTSISSHYHGLCNFLNIPLTAWL